MPSMAVYDMDGAKTGDVEVSADLMDLPFNADLIQQAVVYVDAQRKRRISRAKTRAEVDLTTAKWFRQKGLGRARHGSRKAPTFVGGGKAHGPTGEQRPLSMPRKMRRRALLGALSYRARHGKVTIVAELKLEVISTKRFAQIIQDLGLRGRVLMLLGDEEARDEVLYKSARNVPLLVGRPVPHFNARDVVWADEVLMTSAALRQLTAGGSEDADQ